MKKIISILFTALLIAGLCWLIGCDKKSKKADSDAGWEITQSATCTKAGTRTRVLASGKEETQTIEPTGHEIVTDEAVEATCTTDGLTEGSHCTKCGEVFCAQEVIPAHHTVQKLSAIAPTCVRAGKSVGERCTLCGEIVTPQKKIRQKGHHYVNGICTNCHCNMPDQAAALLFDQFSEVSPASFITKKAYPGGSTVSFRALVPKDATWWAVCYSHSAADTGLYRWTKGADHGVLMTSKSGHWADYSVTIPQNGKYYIYIVGAKGEWKGNPLLVDDLKITDGKGRVLATEDFDGNLEQSNVFSVQAMNPDTGMAAVTQKVICENHVIKRTPAVKATCSENGKTVSTYCAKCKKVLKQSTVLPATGHRFNILDVCTVCGQHKTNNAAVLYVDHFNEFAPMNFITAKAYPGGSVVTFKAKVPKGVEESWWAVSYTTDPQNADLYQWTKGADNGKVMTSTFGEWHEYTVVLPDTAKQYYVYIVGAKGEWKGKALMLNDFKITDPDGKILGECDFDSGLYDGFFRIVETDPTDDSTAVTLEVLPDPCNNGHTVVKDAAVKVSCETDGKTAGSHCSVCGKVIEAPVITPATGHKYNEQDVCTVCGQHKPNLAAAIYIDHLNESAPMNFITKKAYPGGSTVTFDAWVPTGVESSWWAIGFTTDPANADLYRWTSGAAYGQAMPSKFGEWAHYTVTLPNTANRYYIYIVGAKGEWKGKKLLVDDFRISDSKGTVLATEDFSDGLKTGIFTIKERGSADNSVAVTTERRVTPCDNGHTVVDDPAVKRTCTTDGKTAGSHCSVCGKVFTAQTTLPALGHEFDENGICVRCGLPRPNNAVAIYIDQLNESAPMNFITKKAYPGGSTVTFRALVPTGVEKSWWAVGFTTDPAKGGLYTWTEGAVYGQMMTSKFGEWSQYTVTLPKTADQYYIYIVGAKGEWNGKALLVDDFSITSGDTTVTDSFTDGLSAGLFNVIAVNPLNQQTAVKIAELNVENKAVSLKIDSLSEATPMSFITKNAYAGGSTVSFSALVPNGAKWWAVCFTTDPADADLYKWNGHPEYGEYMVPKTQYGIWVTYNVALPVDDKKYYIYIVGEKGQWQGKGLLIDDFSVTTNGVTVTDNFNNGASAGLFNADTAVSTVTKED